MVNVRVIVPRRSDGGHRDRIWNYCKTHWEHELAWPIIEGHHEDGPWNRSKAINRAAEGDWDVAVILDADVIVDTASLVEAVELATSSGRMVIPYERRWHVNAAGTRLILDACYDGEWADVAKPDPYIQFCSSANIVPRSLWTEVGGFDERFVGWGGDDDAFHAACLALAGVERLPGIVWHLDHAIDPTRQAALDAAKLRRPCAGYRQSKLLAERYRNTENMRALLDEPRTEDQIVLVCLTNGKRDTLAKTLDSADRMLTGPIGRKLIVQTGTAPIEHDGWETVNARAGSYTRAVSNAWDQAIGSGQPWVFWIEDDFVFETPVDLGELQAAMDLEPRLVQMVLLRQAWYPEELEAGGLIPARLLMGQPVTQRTDPHSWVQHWAFWSMNPMLCRRSFMAAHQWPQRAGSEMQFGRDLFTHQTEPLAGLWGSLDDPPRVTHIGTTRAGSGY